MHAIFTFKQYFNKCHKLNYLIDNDLTNDCVKIDDFEVIITDDDEEEDDDDDENSMFDKSIDYGGSETI